MLPSQVVRCTAPLACTTPGIKTAVLNPINRFLGKEQNIIRNACMHQASSRPIPSPPFSSLTFFPLAPPLFHLPSFGAYVPPPPPPPPPPTTFSLLAFGLPFVAHPFLLSLAHAPQEEKYAPAFCPAACTEACAAVRSGARAAKRCVVGGAFSDEDGWRAGSVSGLARIVLVVVPW